MTMFTSSNRTVGKNAPYQGAYNTVAVTPSDATDVPLNSDGHTPRGLYVTGAGNVNVNLTGGGTAVLTGLAAGQTLIIGFTRVLNTSTTATGIIARY